MTLKIFITLLLVFGFASVYYSDNGLLPYPDVEFADAATFPVLKVIDAATLEIDYEGTPAVVKLIGVKVPEAMHPDNPSETAQVEAMAFLHNLLRSESVYLRFEDDAPETAGDLQAYLRRAPDGLFVNLELVRQGYAQVNTRATFRHLALFVHYEERARTAEKGLWAPTSKLQVAQGILPDDDTLVHVTRSGDKFHRENCVFLKRSKRTNALPLGVAKQSHTPCSFCKPLESLKKPLDD